jgi:hypothetical protein
MPLDRRMTHFILCDLVDLPTPLHQEVATLPCNTIPVELIPQGHLTKVEKSRTPRSVPIPALVAPPTSFAECCLRLPFWEQELIHHIRGFDSSISLQACFEQGVPLHLCTDGGALKHVGSIGWVIATEDEILWDGTGSAFGWDANSFRLEGLSHLSLFVFLKSFLGFHRLTLHSPPSSVDTALPRRRPWIRAAADNQGLLQRLAQALHRYESPFPSDALRAKHDVICGIISIVKGLPFEIHWEHVKGHQDAVVSEDQLARMEKLNMLAGDNAGVGLQAAIPQRAFFFIAPSIVELRVNSTTITSHFATNLRQAAGTQDSLKWFTANYRWTSVMFNFVDWDAHLAAIRKLTFSEKRFISKFNLQWLLTGHQQRKIDPAQSTLCPSCKNPDVDKTKTHLCQCPHRLPLVGDLFNQLHKFHEREHTAPAPQDTLFPALQNGVFGRPPVFFFDKNKQSLVGDSCSEAASLASGLNCKNLSHSPSRSTGGTSLAICGFASSSISSGHSPALSGRHRMKTATATLLNRTKRSALAA